MKFTNLTTLALTALIYSLPAFAADSEASKKVADISEVLSAEVHVTRDVFDRMLNESQTQGAEQQFVHADYELKAASFLKEVDTALAAFEKKLARQLFPQVQLFVSNYNTIVKSTSYSDAEKASLLDGIRKQLEGQKPILFDGFETEAFKLINVTGLPAMGFDLQLGFYEAPGKNRWLELFIMQPIGSHKKWTVQDQMAPEILSTASTIKEEIGSALDGLSGTVNDNEVYAWVNGIITHDYLDHRGIWVNGYPYREAYSYISSESRGNFWNNRFSSDLSQTLDLNAEVAQGVFDVVNSIKPIAEGCKSESCVILSQMLYLNYLKTVKANFFKDLSVTLADGSTFEIPLSRSGAPFLVLIEALSKAKHPEAYSHLNFDDSPEIELEVTNGVPAVKFELGKILASGSECDEVISLIDEQLDALEDLPKLLGFKTSFTEEDKNDVLKPAQAVGDLVGKRAASCLESAITAHQKSN